MSREVKLLGRRKNETGALGPVSLVLERPKVVLNLKVNFLHINVCKKYIVEYKMITT